MPDLLFMDVLHAAAKVILWPSWALRTLSMTELEKVARSDVHVSAEDLEYFFERISGQTIITKHVIRWTLDELSSFPNSIAGIISRITDPSIVALVFSAYCPWITGHAKDSVLEQMCIALARANPSALMNEMRTIRVASTATKLLEYIPKTPIQAELRHMVWFFCGGKYFPPAIGIFPLYGVDVLQHYVKKMTLVAPSVLQYLPILPTSLWSYTIKYFVWWVLPLLLVKPDHAKSAAYFINGCFASHDACSQEIVVNEMLKIAYDTLPAATLRSVLNKLRDEFPATFSALNGLEFLEPKVGLTIEAYTSILL